MKKLAVFALALITILVCALTVSVSIFAADADSVVYVDSANGNDSADGKTPATAFKTLDAAIKTAEKNNVTVVLVSDYNIPTHYNEPTHKGVVTITSKDGDKDYGAQLTFANLKELTYRLNGPTTFKNMKIKMTNFVIMAAQFNPIVFDEGLTVTGGSSYFFVLGGFEKPEKNAKTSLNSSITINSGSFYKISGFNRTRGEAGTDFTGTATFNINGGNINTLYGASLYYYYSGKAVFNINGGNIATLCVGGDVTRQLKGKATLKLNGGKITKIDINNATGGADVTFAGTTFNVLGISYYNDSLKTAAETAGAEYTAKYNALFYSQKQADAIEKTFDKVENFAVVYAKEGGNGNGFTADTPVGTLADAMEKLKTAGGTVEIAGKLNVDGKFTVASGGDVVVHGGELCFANGASLQADSPITFSGVAFSFADGTGASNSLVANANVTVDGDCGDLTLNATVNNGATLATRKGMNNVTVNGGHFSTMGGKIGAVLLKSEQGKTCEFSIDGGEVASVATDSGFAGKLLLGLYGGKIGELNISGKPETNVILGNCDINIKAFDVKAGNMLAANDVPTAVFDKLSAGFNVLRGNVRYVNTGIFGDGTSPLNPQSNLRSAIKNLGGDGYVVVMGEHKAQGNVIENHDYNVVITSVDALHDYREADSVMLLAGNQQFGGPTTLEKINIQVDETRYLIARGNKLVIGEEVKTELVSGNTTYPAIIGGSLDASSPNTGDITVNSGDWSILRGGTHNTGAALEDADIKVVINGGVFHSYVVLGSRGIANGKVTAEINGGKFLQGLYGVYEEDSSNYTLRFDFNITVNGGEIHGIFAPAKNKNTLLLGTYNVVLNGGDWAHLTDMWGSEPFKGRMTSNIEFGSGFDITSIPNKNVEFSNALRKGADPHLFYYDGYYYMCCTASTTVSLFKTTNLADMATAASYVICKPSYGKNMWSPEIHRFTAEEVGEENAGWYLYFGFDDGSGASMQRQYVVKCLDGDDLLGRWGNPVTGKVNDPQKVVVEGQPEMNRDALCGGTSPIRINGKLYVTFISEVGRGTADFHQTVNICSLVNPWTYQGPVTTICVPEYDWEMGGYGYSAPIDDWYPKVVEGAAAVYDDNGNPYLMYTGSGYWTIYYQLGYLKFKGGDPLKAENWEKNPDSIFSLSDEINGCGHGSYTTAEDGQKWIAYHGYIGKDTSSKRYVFFEPYKVTENGPVIGNGSGHPASLETVYSVPVSKLSLEDKIGGFDNFMGTRAEEPVVTEPVTDPVVTDPAQTENTGDVSGDVTEPKPADGNPVVFIIIAVAVVAVIAIVAFILKKKTNKEK
ncbi:MAG: family 43 glycosylhydrolase [Clostridia bacterium]|nr:family 43 glycosylhydrolase [Clostridia bacterium]